MREIHVSAVTEAIAALAVSACCQLPSVLYETLKQSISKEVSPLGREMLQQLVRNADIAAQESVPLCQDTGLAVVFAEVGQDVHLVGGPFEDAIHQGVAKGYTEGWLRKSCVAEPLFDRVNTGDNAPAIVHVRLVPGDRIYLKLAPKGAGSENKSALKMLVPADGIEGLKRFVLETVRAAGASPCPPMLVGVGIGGNLEQAALCAKLAAVRDVDTWHPDPRYAALEKELLEQVNRLGIGPQGLGGRLTALKVNVEYAATHIASLPVAVNINCHAARHAEILL